VVAVRRLALGVGAAAVGAVMVAGKSVVHRERRQVDPDVPPDFIDLADLGVEHLTVTGRDGAHLHLLAKGEGRPILFLHGILLQAGAWREQFALADRYRVIALDQRGHGRSTAGPAGYGLTRLSDDIDAVIDQQDLRGVILVGHSMGGMAAMRFARRHRATFDERVDGLVLVSTSPLPVFGFGSSRVSRALAGALRLPAGAIGWDRVPTFRPGDDDFNFGVVRLSFGGKPSPAHVDATRRMVAAMEEEAFSRSLVALLDNDERAHLDEIDKPTVVVVGSRDLLTPPHHSRQMAGRIPGAELRVLDGCGHQLMLERPAELAEAIDAVVARADALASSR
jgi:pimeloyl-ACP methyl ester carboxylesterase